MTTTTKATKSNLSRRIAGVRSRQSSRAREECVCEAPCRGGDHQGAYAATAERQDGYAMVRLVSRNFMMLMFFPELADAALGEGTEMKLHKLDVGETKVAPSYPSCTSRPFILFLSSSE